MLDFLKRTPIEGLQISDLPVGSKFNVFGRQMVVEAYGCEFTEQYFLRSEYESTLALIKPDAYLHIGQIISRAQSIGLVVRNIRMLVLPKAEAGEFYAEHRFKEFFANLVEYITSDVVVAVELCGKNAVAEWRRLMGPTSSLQAKRQEPESIRALFGTDSTRNAVHGSDSRESAVRELSFFFKPNTSPFANRTTALLHNCSLCLVKPQAVAQHTGDILNKLIEANLEVSAIDTFSLTLAAAEEFLEVYKGADPQYTEKSRDLSSGQVVAIEVRENDVVTKLRQICGPADPEIARRLAPTSIRALFGEDTVKNAVHCTDLPEDGLIECEYFFKILKSL